MGTVYAVASAKGGVGKTTTTAAIATILAESGADVVAIDADIGVANLAKALGVTPDETTVHDVLAGRADPLDAVHEGPAGLRVVPGETDLDAYAAADPTELRGVVDAFDDADYVLLDAGAGLSHDSALPLAVADETLLISTPDRSVLVDAEKTRRLADRLGGSVAGAAITRVTPDGAAAPDGSRGDTSGEAGSEGDAAATIGTDVLGRIPEDDAVPRAETAGEPLVTFAPTAPASLAYRELTGTLTRIDVEEAPDDGMPGGSETGAGAGGAEAAGAEVVERTSEDEPEGNERTGDERTGDERTGDESGGHVGDDPIEHVDDAEPDGDDAGEADDGGDVESEDDLAESVPFHDDADEAGDDADEVDDNADEADGDADEADDDADEAGGDAAEADDDESSETDEPDIGETPESGRIGNEDKTDDGEGDEDDGDGGSGGFFSRLLGR